MGVGVTLCVCVYGGVGGEGRGWCGREGKCICEKYSDCLDQNFNLGHLQDKQIHFRPMLGIAQQIIV